MALDVRLMTESEANLIIKYFRESTPEHLETLGVDPTRLPSVEAWQRHFRTQLSRPLQERSDLMVAWLSDDAPIGFSTADKIVFGQRANMHLHVIEPENCRQGFGTECVRKSADLYFETLKLRQLFCEPNAFNTAPNRTLQKVGFKFVKTHMTVPGPLNFHQAVNQWVLEWPSASFVVSLR